MAELSLSLATIPANETHGKPRIFARAARGIGLAPPARWIRSPSGLFVLRLTLLVSAIASATFAATLAFAPAVIEAGQRFVLGQADTPAASPIAVEPVQDCAPLAKIVAALRHSGECP
jgi:hypothetical protein